MLFGRGISEKSEVPLRTVFRDIETLIPTGFPIEGERGVGYILCEFRQDFRAFRVNQIQNWETIAELRLRMKSVKDTVIMSQGCQMSS